MGVADLTPLIEVGMALNVAYVGLDRFRDAGDDKISKTKNKALGRIHELCKEYKDDSDYKRLSAFPKVHPNCENSAWTGRIGRGLHGFIYVSKWPEYISAFTGFLLLITMTIAGFIGTGGIIEAELSKIIVKSINVVVIAGLWIPVCFLVIWYYLYNRARACINEWESNLLGSKYNQAEEGQIKAL